MAPAAASSTPKTAAARRGLVDGAIGDLLFHGTLRRNSGPEAAVGLIERTTSPNTGRA